VVSGAQRSLFEHCLPEGGAITEIALKRANAVPPTHFISGAPNAADADL
jgi:hypothetical protein